MKLGAELSEDRKYRYSLFRIWNETVPALMFIMLNPSTADEGRDDPTIKRCMGFALNEGYGGIEVYNLFAFRSTSPGLLLNKSIDPVGEWNSDRIIKAAKTQAGRKIICAWGRVSKGLSWRAADVLVYLKDLELMALELGKRRRSDAPTLFAVQA